LKLVKPEYTGIPEFTDASETTLQRQHPIIKCQPNTTNAFYPTVARQRSPKLAKIERRTLYREKAKIIAHNRNAVIIGSS
jgi:hypothetical protein